MTGDPVIRLLRSTRRRLWWETIAARLPAAAWLGGLTLVVVGALGLLPGIDPGIRTVAALTLAAMLAGLVPGLIARPSWTAAALRVDRTFASHALMVSAIEAAADPPSPARAAVVARARTAAREWYGERTRLRQRPAVAGAALALIPAFLGVLLLRLPATSEPDTPATATAVRPATTASLGSSQEDTRSLRRLRETLAAGTEDRRSRLPRGQQAEPDMTGAVRPDGRERDATAFDELAGNAGFAAAATGERGAEAGDARAGEAEDMDETPTGITAEATTAVARTGAPVASGRSAGAKYAEEASAMGRTGTVQPAAAPPRAEAWSMLSAAQVAYARRYLAANGTRDD